MKTLEQILDRIESYQDELNALESIDLNELDSFEIDDLVDQIKRIKFVIGNLNWTIND